MRPPQPRCAGCTICSRAILRCATGYSGRYEVIGTRRPAAEDIQKLSYTEQVINEALRLYSPIHSISRVATEDNTIGGYHIRKGSTVVVSMYATHRLPRYWLDPERFDPERFALRRQTERP